MNFPRARARTEYETRAAAADRSRIAITMVCRHGILLLLLIISTTTTNYDNTISNNDTNNTCPSDAGALNEDREDHRPRLFPRHGFPSGDLSAISYDEVVR